MLKKSLCLIVLGSLFYSPTVFSAKGSCVKKKRKCSPLKSCNMIEESVKEFKIHLKDFKGIIGSLFANLNRYNVKVADVKKLVEEFFQKEGMQLRLKQIAFFLKVNEERVSQCLKINSEETKKFVAHIERGIKNFDEALAIFDYTLIMVDKDVVMHMIDRAQTKEEEEREKEEEEDITFMSEFNRLCEGLRGIPQELGIFLEKGIKQKIQEKSTLAKVAVSMGDFAKKIQQKLNKKAPKGLNKKVQQTLNFLLGNTTLEKSASNLKKDIVRFERIVKYMDSSLLLIAQSTIGKNLNEIKVLIKGFVHWLNSSGDGTQSFLDLREKVYSDIDAVLRSIEEAMQAFFGEARKQTANIE